MFEYYGDMITISDLCEILAIGTNSAYQLLRTNQIKAFRIGRVWKIPRISVEEYILDTCNKSRRVH